MQQVLQEETDKGWVIHSISQPFIKEGYFKVLLTFSRYEEIHAPV